MNAKQRVRNAIFSLAIRGCAAVLLLGAWLPGASRKHAFLVGINAYEPPSTLSGCVNDAREMGRVLRESFGFAEGDVTVLLDSAATRAGILAGLQSAAARCGRGDLLLFFYSGHGCLFPDSRSEVQDETRVVHFTDPKMLSHYRDGKFDTAICPVDCRNNTSGKPWGNLILDDEIYDILGPAAARGACVVTVYDSCQSADAARGLDDGEFAVKSMTFTQATGVEPEDIPEPDHTEVRSLGEKAWAGGYLAISSSRNEEFSAEHRDERGNHCGRFTYSLLRSLRETGAADGSYRRVFEKAQDITRQLALRSSGSQTPSLDSRFWTGSLDEPVFSVPGGGGAPAPTAPTPSGLRVAVLVKDAGGVPIPGAMFCVLKPGHSAKAAIRSEDLLLIGKTNEKGLFDSQTVERTVAAGVYEVKAVKEGYQSFVGVKEIRPSSQAGVAVLLFVLQPE